MWLKIIVLKINLNILRTVRQNKRFQVPKQYLRWVESVVFRKYTSFIEIIVLWIFNLFKY